MTLNTYINPKIYGTSRDCNVCLLVFGEKIIETIFKKMNERKNDVEAVLKYVDKLASKKMPKNKNLQQCQNCNLVLYCSKEHANADKPFHEEFCNAVSYIKKLAKIDHPLMLRGYLNAANLQLSILQLRLILTHRLKNGLTNRELELISFPAYCKICFKLTDLVHCECRGVSYCGSIHRFEDVERHRRECCFFRIHYSPFQLVEPLSNLITSFKSKVYNFKHIDLYAAFEQTTGITLTHDPTSSFSDYNKFMLANSFSHIATLCYGLSFFQITKTCDKDVPYHIFIIGSNLEAVTYFREYHMKFFLLHFSQFSEIHLTFMGPEITSFKSFKRVITVKDRQYTIIYKSFKHTFQDFCNGYVAHPSVIICYHPDFADHHKIYDDMARDCAAEVSKSKTANPSGNDSKKQLWPDGLKDLILCHKIPIFYTSHTKSIAKMDYGMLLNAADDGIKINMKRMFDLKKNIHGGFFPYRNMDRFDHETLFSENNYLEVIVTDL